MQKKKKKLVRKNSKVTKIPPQKKREKNPQIQKNHKNNRKKS